MTPVRRTVLLSAVAATIATAVRPTPATAASPILGGDLLVLRTGDGSPTQAVSSYTASVFVDDFRLIGGTLSLFQSIPVPTDAANALTLNATATTEGSVNVSTDGNYLVFGGYRKAPATGSPSNNTSKTTPRVIGRLSLADGTVDTSTVLTTNTASTPDLFSGGSIRDVASTDGTHFWVTGTDGHAGTADDPNLVGIVYTPALGPVNSVTLAGTNSRGVGIYGGQLYTASATTVRTITAATGGLPTATPVTNGPSFITGLAGTQNLAAFDLDPTVAGIDTVYVTDQAGKKVIKYSLTDPANPANTASWTNNGSVAVDTAAFNIAGYQTAAGVVLYYTNNSATPTTVASILGTLTDTSGYNAAPTGAGAHLATSLANTNFRGVAIVPTAGDVTGDFVLDADDYAVLDRFVAKNGLGAANASRLNGDLNSDGKVDAADYLVIDAAYLAAHPAAATALFVDRESRFGADYVAALTAAVPEPASVVACVFAIPALRRRCRR